MATGRIGVTPVLRTRWSKQPTAGTTSLSGLDDNSVSLVYDVGYEAVYRNGVLLSRGNDYTATTGNSITLIDATIAGDIIEVFANELVPLADAISKGQFTAKGALLSATAASTPGVLAVGANDTVLTADSTTATGLKWAAPSAGAMTFISRTVFTSAASVTLDNIFSNTYENYVVQIISDGGTSLLCMQGRISGSTITSSDYTTAVRMVDATGSASNFAFSAQTNWKINASNATPDKGLTYFNFFRQSSSTRLRYTTTVWDDANIRGGAGGGTCVANNTWTGLHFFPTTGNMTGTVTVYGLASA